MIGAAGREPGSWLTRDWPPRPDGPRELAARWLTAAQIMVMVCTVASAEIAGLIAEEAESDYRRVQALKDWILDAAGQLTPHAAHVIQGSCEKITFFL
jgi:hypothetical protein